MEEVTGITAVHLKGLELVVLSSFEKDREGAARRRKGREEVDGEQETRERTLRPRQEALGRREGYSSGHN